MIETNTSTTNMRPGMRAKAWGLALAGLFPVNLCNGLDGPWDALSGVIVIYLITAAILSEIWLRTQWPVSIALCWVAAMLFTPADPASMIFVGVPLSTAYGIFAWLRHRATSITTN